MIGIISNAARMRWVLTGIIFVCGFSSVMGQEQASLSVKISLRNSTLHAGDALLIDVVTTNLTDHIIRVGGIKVEAIDKKGKDWGPHIWGDLKDRSIDSSAEVLHTATQPLLPGHPVKAIMNLHPDYELLAPGVYRLRVYRREAKSAVETNSNSVELTIDR
jgi:hypothetical protein